MKNGEIEVRQARVEDVPSIQSCLASAFAPFRSQYSAKAYTDTVPTVVGLQERLSTMHLFVAECENRVIGTIGCSKTSGYEGHLRGMAVSPEWQGSEAAAMLLSSAETVMQQEGCTAVTLDTTEPLQRAIRFYQKHGYKPSGRVSDFFGMRLHEYVKQL